MKKLFTLFILMFSLNIYAENLNYLDNQVLSERIFDQLPYLQTVCSDVECIKEEIHKIKTIPNYEIDYITRNLSIPKWVDIKKLCDEKVLEGAKNFPIPIKIFIGETIGRIYKFNLNSEEEKIKIHKVYVGDDYEIIATFIKSNKKWGDRDLYYVFSVRMSDEVSIAKTRQEFLDLIRKFQNESKDTAFLQCVGNGTSGGDCIRANEEIEYLQSIVNNPTDIDDYKNPNIDTSRDITIIE